MSVWSFSISMARHPSASFSGGKISRMTRSCSMAVGLIASGTNMSSKL
ncbi:MULTISPECIES: hypothetical protein [Kitasatospora]